MQPKIKARTIPNFLLILAILLAALTARIIPGTRTIDDAYITFRYARNLLNGQGFVYNPGERVLGTTTPLYSLLLVGLGSAAGGTKAPFPTLALGINALADAASCYVLIRLGRKLGFRFAGWAAALAWAIAPFSVTFAIGGLETSLYVFLLLGAVSAQMEDKATLAALLGALAILTRPDAIILVGPLALVRLVQVLNRRNLYWSEVAAFFAPLAGWFGFATLYFGSPFPHSVAAKMEVYRLEQVEGFVRLLQHYANPFFEDNTFGTRFILFFLVLYLFLFLVGALRGWKQNREAWPFFAYPLLYMAVFAAANPLIFRWYLTPPMPMYFLGIFGGLEALLAKNKAGVTHPMREALVLALLFLLPTLSVITEWKPRLDHGGNTPAPEMAFIKLELLYRQAAEIVLSEMNPGETLAAGDVGVLGYVTSAKILDTVGLNSPRALDYYPMDPEYYVINYAIPADLVLQEKPEWVIVLEIYIRKTLLEEPEFIQSYQLIKTLPADLYGSDGLLIYRRVE